MSSHLLWLSLAWLAYFALHSLLASITVKRWVEQHYPDWMPRYRLLFNLLAVLLLIVPLWLLYRDPGPKLIEWQGMMAWVANLVALLAVAGFVWSSRYYDSGEFLGFRQLRDNVRVVEDQEQFRISPLHRFVRHPWYFLGMLLIWTRDMDAGFLLSALLLTAYFVIGSRWEERKLVAYHGEAYRRYRQQVPGLLPLPWRYLTQAQASQLETLAKNADGAAGPAN